MSILSKLDSIKSIDVADFVVRDPDTNQALMVLVLAGPMHPASRALARKYEGDLAQELQRARDPQKVYKRELVNGLNEDIRFEKEIEVLMVRTLDWKKADGTPDDPYDAKAMEATYRLRGGESDKSWLRAQVLQALADTTTFTRSSQTPSSPTASTASA